MLVFTRFFVNFYSFRFDSCLTIPLLLLDMPKLNAVILENIAAQLSDVDLTKFMLSSKGAFAATVNMLSKITSVTCPNTSDEPLLEISQDENNVSFIFHCSPK